MGEDGDDGLKEAVTKDDRLSQLVSSKPGITVKVERYVLPAATATAEEEEDEEEANFTLKRHKTGFATFASQPTWTGQTSGLGGAVNAIEEGALITLITLVPLIALRG